MSVPAGTVTFLFTDIEGSTRLWKEHGQEMARVLPLHDALLREHIERQGGFVFKTGGDSFCAAFATVQQAVACAVGAQIGLQRMGADGADADGGSGDLRPPVGMGEGSLIKVRMGVHAGEALLREGDYFGGSLSTVARVMEAGHGGQILLTLAARSLLGERLAAGAELVDLGVHRLRDVGTEHLFQLCPPRLPRDFPPLRTLDPRVHRLPLPPTPLIGRQAVCDRAALLLTEMDRRIVTLCGFGGIGKSRVALHVAESVAEQYPDGVWWVDLESVTTADAAVAEIARQIQMRIQPDAPLEGQLLDFLRFKRRLLVLDNVEQIAGFAAVVARTLAQAGETQYLVTSRRPLDLRAEQVVEVDPLEPGEAEQLFLDRARSRSASFSVETADHAAVAALCDRLERVPLAIELAATRVPGMTVPEISARLSERFRLLRAGLADLPPRHQALRVTIEWSYNLLPPEVQETLAELSLFAGPFTAEDAEAVCGGWEALDSLLELRNHSLLRAESAGATTWYAMFESVRAFAAEKLAADPERAAMAKQKFVGRFQEAVEAWEGRMRSSEERAVVTLVQRELPNIRAALGYAREGGEAESYAGLVYAFCPFLQYLGLIPEARDACEKAWDSIHHRGTESTEEKDCSRVAEWQSRGDQAPEGGLSAHAALAGAVAFRRSSVLYDLGDLEAAREWAEAAREMGRAAGSTLTEVQALNMLGVITTDQGDLAAGRRALEEALAIGSSVIVPERANVLHNLARLEARAGDSERARALYEETLALRRATRDERGVAAAVGNLGILSYNRGDYAEAERLYKESLEINRRLGFNYGLGAMLINLAEVAEAREEKEKAATLYFHAARVLNDLLSPEAKVAEEGLGRVGLAPLEGVGWEVVVFGEMQNAKCKMQSAK